MIQFCFFLPFLSLSLPSSFPLSQGSLCYLRLNSWFEESSYLSFCVAISTLVCHQSTNNYKSDFLENKKMQVLKNIYANHPSIWKAEWGSRTTNVRTGKLLIKILGVGVGRRGKVSNWQTKTTLYKTRILDDQSWDHLTNYSAILTKESKIINQIKRWKKKSLHDIDYINTEKALSTFNIHSWLQK